MKKKFSLITIAIILIASTVNAQIQRGNILVGGDIANFDLVLRKGSPFVMRIDPKLAYFIQDNLAVGGYVNLGLTSITGTTFFDYGVGLLGRYYFPDKTNMNPLRHSRLFAEANVGITGQNASGGGNNTNGLGIGFGPGYAYFITQNIGLEVLLKYNGLVGFGNATTQSDLNLNVGFQIYLPTRKLKSKIESDVR
jgi:hypothetical protein